MDKKHSYSIKDRLEYLKNRDQEIRRLRRSASKYPDSKIPEYIDTILKSYELSSIVRKLAVYHEDITIESRGFRSIGLYEAIKKDEFFAKNYTWIPFFSDVGRAISRGEQKYITTKLSKIIRGENETISISDPDFQLVTHNVLRLTDRGVKPNTMLAPIQIFSEFIQKYWVNLSEFKSSTKQIEIEGCKLDIVWSHKYAPLNSFILFDSSAAVWHSLPDLETGKGISIAIGESKNNPNRMEFLAEVMAYYEVLNKDAFVRIKLSKWGK
jgi:hypothetical protein